MLTHIQARACQEAQSIIHDPEATPTRRPEAEEELTRLNNLPPPDPSPIPTGSLTTRLTPPDLPTPQESGPVSTRMVLQRWSRELGQWVTTSEPPFSPDEVTTLDAALERMEFDDRRADVRMSPRSLEVLTKLRAKVRAMVEG
jgi:hypothetical protein